MACYKLLFILLLLETSVNLMFFMLFDTLNYLNQYAR